jgi:hypothetical protein
MIDESRIDTDLASAIRRIREDPDTAHHRILVVSRDEVLPEPEEEPELDRPAVVLEPAPPSPSRDLARRPESVARRAEGESLRRIGAIMQRRSEVVDIFIAAGKRVAEELKTAPYEGNRLHLKRAIRRHAELMEWLDVANRDLLYVAGKASQGMEELSTADLLRDAARVTRLKNPDVQIRFVKRDANSRVYADPFDGFHAFVLALDMLSERIGRRGRIAVRVEQSAFHLDHHLQGIPAEGAAAPGDSEVGMAAVARLRHLVVERHAGRILPGDDGAKGSSMILGLPLRRFEAEIRA